MFTGELAQIPALRAAHQQLEAITSNIVSETFTHNEFGELAAHAVKISGTPLMTTVYHAANAPRDALGRISTKTVTRNGRTRSTRYGYDVKGQLTTVETEGEPTRTYEYDPNGNRRCSYDAPATGCDEEAVYDAQDRLLASEGVEYRYTDRGTLFQRDDGTALETFTYDALGNLTGAERQGEWSIEYIIDAQGRRIGKRVNGVLQRQYVWSNALRIEGELDGAGNVISRFIYGTKPNVPDLIVKPAPGGTRLYRVITDHLGSPIYVVNIADASDVLLDASYDAWGEVTDFQSTTGDWTIPFGFAGGLYDVDTGLVRFGVRDYDPRIGRWTNKDPIRWAGRQANLYVYVSNDAINRRDPVGLWEWSDVPVQALRGAWTSIQVTVGLAVGFVGSGTDAAVVDGNLEFYDNAIVSNFAMATTFGNVVVYGVQTPTRSLRIHEQQHVPQSDLLGPLYLPAHILNQLVGEAILGMPHPDTPLECGPSDPVNPRPWP